MLDPKVSRLCWTSAWEPLRPVDRETMYRKTQKQTNPFVTQKYTTVTFTWRSVQLFTNFLYAAKAIEFGDTLATPKLHEFSELLEGDSILSRSPVYRRHITSSPKLAFANLAAPFRSYRSVLPGWRLGPAPSASEWMEVWWLQHKTKVRHYQTLIIAFSLNLLYEETTKKNESKLRRSSSLTRQKYWRDNNIFKR